MTTVYVSQPKMLYHAYLTNADLEQLILIYSGWSRDVAESKMFKRFMESGGLTDYMLIEQYTQNLVSVLFCPKTKRLRNECQD